MRPCSTLFLLAIAASAQEPARPPAPQTTPPAATQAARPGFTLRSGQVITCRVGEGCTEERRGDRLLYTLDVDGLTVQAAIGYDGGASHADLTILNGTPESIQVIPGDLRMEVTQPTLDRLSYLDPANPNLHRSAAKPAKPQVHDLPPPSYWTSPEHAEDKQAMAAARSSSATPLLRPVALAPGASTSGRVFFEHRTGIQRMSLVVPIAGAAFEFPYTAPPQPPSHRHFLPGRRSPPAAQAPSPDASAAVVGSVTGSVTRRGSSEPRA